MKLIAAILLAILFAGSAMLADAASEAASEAATGTPSHVQPASAASVAFPQRH